MATAKTAIPSSQSSLTNSEDIAAILKVLQIALDSMQNDVAVSKLAHPVGAQTELIKSISEVIENPLPSLMHIASDLDGRILSVLRRICDSFLSQHSQDIASAFLMPMSANGLTYLVSLNEDSSDHRDALLNFLDAYEETGTYQNYPIRFQFFPKNLADRVTDGEQILL